MERRPASDCVRTARANIRLANQICEGADLARLQEAFTLLETTVAEMRQAETEVRTGMTDGSADLRRETKLLKREIAGAMRVVDGCAALCRGLSIRLGLTALTYTPQGRSVAATLSAAECELQG